MSKKARSEGNRVAMAIKANKANYYIADVDLEDDGEDVVAAAQSVRKTLGKLQSGFMLISAGVKNLIVVVDLLDSTNLNAQDWISDSLENITSYTKTDNPLFSKIVLEMDTPFKLKDIVRSNAFSTLRSRSLLEEESEEENYEFE